MSDLPTFGALFAGRVPLIGMVHLPPLPGSPRWGGDMDAVLARARRDAEALAEGGAGGIMVENFGDVPFSSGSVSPATIAAVTRAVEAVRRTVGDALPVGVNVLRNDAAAALSIAAVTGASFVRANVHAGVMVTDQGIIEGRAHDTMMLRRLLGAPVLLFADVLSKHAAPLGETSIELAVADTIERGLADAVIVTGAATGHETDLSDVAQARAAAKTHPVLVGSGVTINNIAATLRIADGVIVGTGVKVGGVTTNPVDVERVRALVAAARGG